MIPNLSIHTPSIVLILCLLYVDLHVDPLQVVCGNPASKLRCAVKLPTESALAEFHQLNACLPKQPHRYAQRMLALFFSNEVLANSNCTPAKGRQLVDQHVLLAIKRKFQFHFSVY